ncbi:hypothetical protein LCGC14_0650230 [marine sediment metagenome]|uniref:Uncharacterized protein n=1 Tax=marine sediment metagenome TaxID=412755 RepID=A0A0F9R1T4_9ZZZZ|nr:hypothetical protein [Candidatus Aminicenantes bacterium]
MTPEKLKQLAESAAEFLGADENNCIWVHEGASIEIIPDNLFGVDNDKRVAPSYFMHLGKQEMEKLGFSIRCEHRLNYQRVFIKRDDLEEDWQLSPVYVEDENEFMAFWSALLEAVK